MFRYATIVGFVSFFIVALAFGQAGPNDAVYGRFSNVLGYVSAASLNSANTDIPITVKASKYIVSKFRVTNCSATPVLATLGLYTASAAGGTNLVAAAVLTSLTSAAAFVEMTLINNTLTRTESTLYARNVAAQTSALTCDIYIYGDQVP